MDLYSPFYMRYALSYLQLMLDIGAYCAETAQPIILTAEQAEHGMHDAITTYHTANTLPIPAIGGADET
jgi:hypothetical protein